MVRAVSTCNFALDYGSRFTLDYGSRFMKKEGRMPVTLVAG